VVRAPTRRKKKRCGNEHDRPARFAIMKLEKIRTDFENTTGTLSGLVRQLVFAGIAVIWILRVGDKTGGLPYSDSLFSPLRMFVIALICDVGQYAVKTITLGAANAYFWRKYKDENKNVTFSGGWNFPTYALFIAKVFFASVAYCQLLTFMFSQLSPKP
jgi:hypothetical protein